MYRIKTRNGFSAKSAAALLALALAVTHVPSINALEDDLPPPPDLCDDESDGDTFTVAQSGTPAEPAILVVSPSIDILQDDEVHADHDVALLVGDIVYSYLIMDCVDKTGWDESTLIVYKGSAGYVSDGIDITDNQPLYNAVPPARFNYECGGEVGACAFVDRDDAMVAASVYASVMPTYASEDAFLSIGNLEIPGALKSRGSPIGLFSDVGFNGCLLPEGICISAWAIGV